MVQFRIIHVRHKKLSGNPQGEKFKKAWRLSHDDTVQPNATLMHGQKTPSQGHLIDWSFDRRLVFLEPIEIWWILKPGLTDIVRKQLITTLYSCSEKDYHNIIKFKILPFRTELGVAGAAIYKNDNWLLSALENGIVTLKTWGWNTLKELPVFQCQKINLFLRTFLIFQGEKFWGDFKFSVGQKYT